MDTPSPDSAADLMTCLMQGCEVGHSGVTTWADSVSSRLTSAWFPRLRSRCGAACSTLSGLSRPQQQNPFPVLVAVVVKHPSIGGARKVTPRRPLTFCAIKSISKTDNLRLAYNFNGKFMLFSKFWNSHFPIPPISI